MLADLHAGHVGVDGRELAPKLRRRLRLQIESVDRAQPALEKQDEDRDIVLLALRRFSREQARQWQTAAAQAGQADPQHITSRNPVTVASAKHGGSTFYSLPST